ncbi:MAG TPA: hypothetical protein VGJ29_12535 [Vicinamibacterales bacterium]
MLYWFRTPPNVRVGRGPFDPAAQRALELQYPDVAFDWQKLIDTPVPPPPPDVERWRERRKNERAAKQAAREEEAADAAAASEAAAPSPTDSQDAEAEAVAEPAADGKLGDELVSTAEFVVSSTEPLSAASEGQVASGAPNPLRRRRRRRRRGGGGNRPDTPRE